MKEKETARTEKRRYGKNGEGHAGSPHLEGLSMAVSWYVLCILRNPNLELKFLAAISYYALMNSHSGIQAPCGYFILCFKTFMKSPLGIQPRNGHFIFWSGPYMSSQQGSEIPPFRGCVLEHLGMPNWELKFPGSLINFACKKHYQ